MLPREFYIIPEEIFRLGNSNSPRLSNVRPRDVNTTIINGIEVIIANADKSKVVVSSIEELLPGAFGPKHLPKAII